MDIVSLFRKELFEDTVEWYAAIEWVIPIPGMKRGYILSESYGFLRACLIWCGIPFVEARPQKWQKALGFTSKKDPAVVKAKAQRMFPSVKVTHATGSALLIAEYARLYWK